MENELAAGGGKVVFRDYIAAINTYMVPYLGKYSMTGIGVGVIDDFYAWREKLTQKPTCHRRERRTKRKASPSSSRRSRAATPLR